MILDWLAQIPALFVAFAVVFGPGLAVGSGLRLRGFALWAIAPVASTATVAGLALVYGVIGIPWTALSAVLGCAAVTALAWAGGLLLGARAEPGARVPGTRALLAAGLTLGVGFATARFIAYVWDPSAISQTNDAVFHLNALRYIIETHTASSLEVSGVIGGRGFYPSAWHGLASLTALLSGAEVAVAANTVSLVIAAGVWPVGIAFLTYQATGRRAGAAALAALLASGLHVFPMLMFQWGVLYSYALAVALVPAAVAVAVSIPAWVAGRGPLVSEGRAAVLAGILLIGSLGALALSQPASILAFAIASFSFVIWWLIGNRRELRGRSRGLAIAGTAIATAAFVAIWFALTRSTSGSHWPPFRGKFESVVDVLLGGFVLLPAAVGISILSLIGLVVALRRPRLRWLATTWIVFVGLYVVVASIGNPLVRRWLLGAWYADPYRIAAIVPLAAVPLAAIGLAAVAVWAGRALASRGATNVEPRAIGWALGCAAAVMAVVFAVAPTIQMSEVTQGTFQTESSYVTRDYLSDDERDLLEDLPEWVDEGERVIGNPSTGMGFGFMLSGQDVFPRTWAHPRTEAWRTIEQGLRDAADEEAVCEALALYGDPEFVLDFGEGENAPGRYVIPAMTDFEGQDGFELVAERGDASLWRITACAT